MRSVRRARWATVLLVGAAFPSAACEERLAQRPAEPAPALPPPDCGGGVESLPAGHVVAEGTLVPGPTMQAKGIVERFEVRRRDCLLVASVEQDTPLGQVLAEVVFDADRRPLRAEVRRAVPGREGAVDLEVIELRGETPRLERRSWDGYVEHRVLRGERPIAVVGPGRGLLTVWIRAADLAVGEKQRGPVLDLSGYVRIREATLRRDLDREEPTLGRRVRVHTVYGRDSVFCDDSGLVIGDLAGLRPAPDPRANADRAD